MSTSKFKTRVKRFGAKHLVDKGFTQATPYAFERPLDGLIHGIDFAAGTQSLKGKYTVDVYWKFRHNPIVVEACKDFTERIGSFSSGPDIWLSIDDESSYEHVYNFYESKVEPFLQKHYTIESIIRSYETNAYPDKKFFGIDAGWEAYNIGYCYLWLDNVTEAIVYLKRVVEEHSSYPYEWVQERKRVVEATLEEITA